MYLHPGKAEETKANISLAAVPLRSSVELAKGIAGASVSLDTVYVLQVTIGLYPGLDSVTGEMKVAEYTANSSYVVGYVLWLTCQLQSEVGGEKTY